ncbi:MAG: bifunctional hydroxymethylpyrimidine kinase/phosphomethylpyrimidine kinase [Pseudomonadota bacterium]
MTATPIALTIAGSDSGGGAGIQADLKAFSALGVYGASVITALTAQNTRAVTAVHEAPPEMIAAQLAAVFDDLDVRAVKIGMLSSVPIIETVAEALTGHTIPVVLDPVMVAKSGDALLAADAVSALRERLLPLATVITPNLPEAACFLNDDPARNVAEQQAQGEALLALGASAVLMKGGHADGAVCVDLLLQRDYEIERFEAQRISTRNTHGTGCTLSSSIAAGLARGLSLGAAVGAAHRYLHGAIRAADALSVGGGHGPVHHFHALWDNPT